MISISNLTKIYRKSLRIGKSKHYSETVALDNINIKIDKGEIFGLIGPNGAGKTTLLKILSTLIIPDSGTVTIDGYDILKDEKVVKTKVGLLSGEFTRSLYWRLTGRENLSFFAKLKGMWDVDDRIDYLIDIFGLAGYENEMVMKYSTGMKHKLALAVALVNDPPVILLDEPLTGIDPMTSFEIKKIVKEELRGKTIIWTSHNLFEIEEMCDRIALINNGKIIMVGSPHELMKNHWDYEKVTIVCDNPEKLSPIDNIKINKKKKIAEIRTDNLNEILLEISRLIKEKNIRVFEIKTSRPTLEEVFMEVMKNVN